MIGAMTILRRLQRDRGDKQSNSLVTRGYVPAIQACLAALKGTRGASLLRCKVHVLLTETDMKIGE